MPHDRRLQQMAREGSGLDGPRPAPLSLAWKLAISAFLAVHLGAYLIRISPLELPAKQVRFELAGHRLSLYDAARWYQRCTVTSVSGRLFAPLPARANIYIGAEVVLADGSTRPWRFTLPRDVSPLAGRGYTHFHKLGMSLVNRGGEGYYADLARYVARQLAGERPVRVRLLAFHSPIPQHNRAGVHRAESPLWFDYTRMLREQAVYEPRVLGEYEVRSDDLR